MTVGRAIEIPKENCVCRCASQFLVTAAVKLLFAEIRGTIGRAVVKPACRTEKYCLFLWCRPIVIFLSWGELKLQLISANAEAGKLTKGSPLNCSYCGRKNNNKNSLEIKVTLSSGVNILRKIINSFGTWFLDNRNSTGFLYVNFGYI